MTAPSAASREETAWMPETAQTASTAEQALALALAWADGRRSWTNLGQYEPYTPAVIAVMDAAEVVKWSALALALPSKRLGLKGE